MIIQHREEKLPESFKAYIRAFKVAKSFSEQKEVLKNFEGQKWYVEVPITAGDINEQDNYSTVKLDTPLGDVWVTFLEHYPSTGIPRLIRVPSIEEFSRFRTPLITDPV
ncbi:hypothetical protein MOTE_12780 [Moorella thermoacetica]|uniref:Uncharacterized protein n=1 Tax=Neomoorella thermoacetica TaxID=1525 RepID=A0A1J5P6W5_NEOTH|nr:hypothetical protein MOTE_12780 [Moorella thermoacetica]